MPKKTVASKSNKTPNSIDVLIGARVRAQRNLAGISQEQLAQSLNVTFQQIQKYECGLNRITAARLWQLSKIFAVPVSIFFADLPTGPAKPTTKSSIPDVLSFHEDKDPLPLPLLQQKEVLELIRWYLKIKDPTMRQGVLNLVKSLSSKKGKDN